MCKRLKLLVNYEVTVQRCAVTFFYRSEKHDMNWWLYPVIGIVALLSGFLVGYAYRRNVAEAKVAKAEDAVKKLYDDAQRKAEEIASSLRSSQRQ